MKKILSFLLIFLCFIFISQKAGAEQIQLEGDVLPDYMRIAGCLCGDVGHSYLGLAGYLGTHKIAQDKAWQKEFWPHQRVNGLLPVTVDAGGDSTYVITPKYKGTVINVKKIIFVKANGNNLGETKEALVKVKNKTVILYCTPQNASGHVEIELRYKNKSVRFIPEALARNGKLVLPDSLQDCSDWLKVRTVS